MAVFVALVMAGNTAQRWINHTGLAEACLDGRFSHIEQGRELLGALNAMGEGLLELRAGTSRQPAK